MTEHLISHTTTPISVEASMEKIATRIKKQGDKPYVTVERQLEILEQLSEFDFGRFLLANQGINGFWTHYMLTHPWFGRKTGKNNSGESLTELENFILNRAPIMLATQQRFELFLQENQKQVVNGAKLACIPCGMMGELLYLNFSDIDTIELVGIDFDAQALKDALFLAKERDLRQFTTLVQGDAWYLQYENKFDLISSNGLNIYEPDEKKVTDLYREFFKALKPGGTLVTSFLTYPFAMSEKCEWNIDKMSQPDLVLQKIILVDVVGVKWHQCYRSSETTKIQLESAGFTNVHFIYDEVNVFPTVVAKKKI